MKKYVVGVDFGTLSARAVVTDREGNELGSAVSAYAHGVMEKTLPDGTPLEPLSSLEHPADYLTALKESIAGALAEANVRPSDVVGMGVDFTACTLLPVLEDGTPLCFLPEFSSDPHAYVKLWKHHAAGAEADLFNRVAKERKEPWLDFIGGEISCEWVLPKVLEVYRKSPKAYEKTWRFLEAADWLTFLLTGKETHSQSFATYKGCYVPRYGYPSDEYLAAVEPALVGLYGNKVGEDVAMLGKGNEPCGTITEEGAKLCGLPVGSAVSFPVPDAHSALPGCGIAKTGEMLLVVGTSTVCMFHDEKTCPVYGMSGLCEGGVMPGLTSYEAGQTGCGDALDWYLANALPVSVRKEAEERKISVHELLREKASALRVGENGLLTFDWWAGNRCLLNDPKLSGMILGLTLTTTPEEIYRAMLEGAAFGTRRIVECFRSAGMTINRMIAAGGIARKDPLLMQIYADVLNVTLDVSETKQAGARGTCVYAATAAGLYPDVTAATLAMAPGFASHYDPIPENVAAYDRLYAEYRRLHAYFGEGENYVMHALADIRAEARRGKEGKNA